MGLYANRPLAVAPYMGENAFIAYTLSAMAFPITWQERLGSVFVAGVIFLVLTLFGARKWLAQAIPHNLKHSFAIGIGLFLLFIGMTDCGLVVHGPPPGPPVRIGDLRDLRVQLALVGFTLMAALMIWNVRGAMLIGIGVIGVAGYLLNVGEAPTGVVAWPWNYELEKVAFQLDILGVLRFDFLTILMTLVLISFLDTLGTLYAVAATAGMLDEHGNLVDVEKPMIVDSVSCIFSALVGTSTSGAFIESATGIREGARTGLASVVTGLCFLVALFFVPLLQPLQKFAFAYGPALMVVGILMFGSVQKLHLDDWTELVPVVVTIVMMIFTFNVANGLTAGLIAHPVMKLLALRWRAIHPGAALLAALSLLYYAFGNVH
jgi:AGZA family xanthine/uracil permease-like MFS transporter